VLDFGNDPAIFSHVQDLSTEIIDHFFKLGPSQPTAHEMPNKCFKKDSLGRSFHDSWYWKKLPSGEIIRRKWMTYSKTEKKLGILFLLCIIWEELQNKLVSRRFQ